MVFLKRPRSGGHTALCERMRERAGKKRFGHFPCIELQVGVSESPSNSRFQDACFSF